MAALAALPAAASASHDELAPPSNSGIDAYTESVPEAGGDRRLGSTSNEPSNDSGSAGGTGEAPGHAAAGAAGSRGGGSGGSEGSFEKGGFGGPEGRGNASQDGSDRAPVSAEEGSGVLDVVGTALSGASGGMGVALSIILAAALLATSLLLLARRQRAKKQIE